MKKEVLHLLAAAYMKAERPLALAEGMGYQDPMALDTARAANLLSRLVPGSAETIDFSSTAALSETARAGEMKEWTDIIRAGRVEVLFILRANPAFHLPPQWGFSEALKSVRLVVSLGSFPDESNRMAHLIMPTHTFLEEWGDYSPRKGVRGLLQPVMGPLFDTRATGDVLLSLGRRIRGAERFPEKDFYEVLRGSWTKHPREGSAPPDPEAAWQASLRQGGSYGLPERTRSAPGARPSPKRVSFTSPAPSPPGGRTLSFVTYPTVQFFDGRLANRPFLQEMPDPMTQITWGGWVEIHPETAKAFKIERGDVLSIRSSSGTFRAAAYPCPWITEKTLAAPIGHGSTSFGRYAASGMDNPSIISGEKLDEAGGIARAVLDVTMARTADCAPLAHTDGSTGQHGREIVRSISWQEYAATKHNAPDITLPLPKGFNKDTDFYPAHTHDTYRWSMAVDLDRCIGCGACVVACYAENNVAFVGKRQVLKGREMAWLHMQRYFEAEEPHVRFLPMLCQHCDEAPCEPVCPVFAPHHSKEGINNQVYNRCIGTRYCSQNCPYKVRRFNWLNWERDHPLEWQLNPDVTARTKGVMEKCSFCIQRINEARIKAKSEGRHIRDGEFTTACAQTCPVDALVFGNLMDPESRVSRLIGQARAYQVLGELNTKPGVIYLKRITRRVI